MIANRGRDTAPELAVRRAAHRLGLRYRVGVRPIRSVRRTADMAFPKEKVAVYVDGCFWHGCPIHYVEPKTNVDYWATKIVTNTERDRETDRTMTSAGWLVLRFWEHEDPDTAATAIFNAVRGRR
jgi:DNA mismatch endonuclease (patch repair protein)